ncbi:MAG: hypothetical protein IPG72_02110 [Ardenticatenales bacterium]|nr:hypothetical protein [Ardenticatenales bacterium]
MGSKATGIRLGAEHVARLEALAPLFGGNRAATVRAALDVLAEVVAVPSALSLALSGAPEALRSMAACRGNVQGD